MKAFVINEDQIKALGLGLIALIVVVFLAGYFLGSIGKEPAEQSQKLVNAAFDEKETNAGDTQAVIDLNKNQSKPVPLSIDNKVDNKTDKKKNNKKPENKKVIEKVKETKKIKEDKAKIKSAKKSLDTKNKTPKNNKPVNGNSKSEKIKPEKNNQKDKKPAAAAAKLASTLNENKASVEEADRVYSIQAGMFSNEANANAFIEKLLVKKFDAYISSFVSGSGATKYNVRVGKFEKRDQARELLKEYQKSFSSPAYVVISQP